jgi:hypothetical protein
VAGCPQPDQHFPIVQLVLPMALPLAAELLQSIAEACRRAGIEGVCVDLPGHGNGRIYAARRRGLGAEEAEKA